MKTNPATSRMLPHDCTQFDGEYMSGGASIHRTFGENLFVLCSKHGSIANVCRELQINRQQFNKYLAGTVLPNATTLEKFAHYFNVPQTAFFQTAEPAGAQPKAPGHKPFGLDELPLAITKRMNRALSFTRRGTHFPEGCYFIYANSSVNAGAIMRLSLLIDRTPPAASFVRYARARPAGHLPRNEGWIRSEGFVMEIKGQTYLVGQCSYGFEEISLVSFSASNLVDQGIFTGLGLTTTMWGEPQAWRATAQFCGPKEDFRKIRQMTAMVPRDSEEIPELVRRSLEKTLPPSPTTSLLASRIFDDMRQVLS